MKMTPMWLSGSNDGDVFVSLEDVADDSDSDDEFTHDDIFNLSQWFDASPVKTPQTTIKVRSVKCKTQEQLNQRIMNSNIVHGWPRTNDLSSQ